LLFICGASCVKSIRKMISDVNQELLLFVHGARRVNSIRQMIRVINQEPLAFCMCWFTDRVCEQK
jgi:hypothetical protein